MQLLERYHARHGAGLVSQHRVLAWTGKLQAADVLKGAHELAAAEEAGRVSAEQPASAMLLGALTAFLRQDPSAAACPPHLAVCGSASDRWLYTTWALQQLEAQVPAELRPAAGGLRTLVLPAGQVGSLADVAWTLSQHPRARFAVVVNSGLEGSSPAVADAAAMLSGVDGFSWPSNAMLIAGFGELPSDDLRPVFRFRL